MRRVKMHLHLIFLALKIESKSYLILSNFVQNLWHHI